MRLIKLASDMRVKKLPPTHPSFAISPNFTKDQCFKRRRDDTKDKASSATSVSSLGNRDQSEDEDHQRHNRKNSNSSSQIQNPSDKYSRRQRHKTKPDRYEYRHAEEKPSTKRPSKKSSRKKAGAALNGQFHAPNVSAERLTLKPKPGPGFLAKGKTSAQIECKGLPDLTFSEMAFLSEKRRQDGARFHKAKLETLSRGDRRNSNQDVSDFFSRQPRYSSGAKSPSRAKEWTRASSTPQLVRQKSTERLRPPESKVPAHGELKEPSLHKQKDICVSSGKEALHHGRFADSISTPLLSTTSSSFLRDLTTESLLHGVEAFAHRGQKYYSLADLKRLARRASSDDPIVNDDTTEYKPSQYPAELTQHSLHCYERRDEVSTAYFRLLDNQDVASMDRIKTSTAECMHNSSRAPDERFGGTAQAEDAQHMKIVPAPEKSESTMLFSSKLKRPVVANDCPPYASDYTSAGRSPSRRSGDVLEGAMEKDLWLHAQRARQLRDPGRQVDQACSTQRSGYQRTVECYTKPSGIEPLCELDAFDLQLLHMDIDCFSDLHSVTTNDGAKISCLPTHECGTSGTSQNSIKTPRPHFPDIVVDQHINDKPLHPPPQQPPSMHIWFPHNGQRLSQLGCHVLQEPSDLFTGFSRPHILS